MMYVVGVTGGIGSGKSTVSNFLREEGAYIFDADTVAKHLLDTDPELQQDLIDEFLEDIIDTDGNIVKEKLARIGFSNKANQETLNEIVHPYVFRAHEEEVEKVRRRGSTNLYVIDAPLLFESGLNQRTEYDILVYAKLKVRLSRAQKRGTLTREQILKRMDLQMPEEEKMELADFIIENNGTEEELKRETLKIYNQILA